MQKLDIAILYKNSNTCIQNLLLKMNCWTWREQKLDYSFWILHVELMRNCDKILVITNIKEPYIKDHSSFFTMDGWETINNTFVGVPCGSCWVFYCHKCIDLMFVVSSYYGLSTDMDLSNIFFKYKEIVSTFSFLHQYLCKPEMSPFSITGYHRKSSIF